VKVLRVETCQIGWGVLNFSLIEIAKVLLARTI